jgi:hypothetical protein
MGRDSGPCETTERLIVLHDFRFTQIGFWWKRQIGRPKCRWKDNIKINLEKIEWDDIYWIDVAEGRNQ